MRFRLSWLLAAAAMLVALRSAPRAAAATDAAPATSERTFRLHESVTAYVNNPDGKDFTVSIDVRDINYFANGPREVLFKVYDPQGTPVVREVIPDDGCVTGNMPERIGGWDHMLQALVSQSVKGVTPWVRWSAWSDPGRLRSIVARTFDRPIKGGQKGIYRVVLAGTPDHYVTLRLSPELKHGFAGGPSWAHGHGDLLRKSYIYVPKGTSGLSFALAEPDMPRARRFKLTAPDGKVIFNGPVAAGYFEPAGKQNAFKVSKTKAAGKADEEDDEKASTPVGDQWAAATAGFASGEYQGKLLTLEVADAPNDYLVRVVLQQAGRGAFGDYGGMGSAAVFCPDEATAHAIAGGTIVADDQVFWHPFQVRFHHWLKANKLDADEKQKALRRELEAQFNAMRLLETSDGRGNASWPNWAYAMGYYGCNMFRPGWLLMKRDDVPAEVKQCIREGLIMAGDRLSFAAGIEKVNGNAFAQINVALWYSHRATGDAIQKERFETFWQRWTTEGWGPGAGLSRSGDSQEHFAHDMHYGSYIMNNWAPTENTWVKGGGILGDATDDPRFAKVMDRYYELYSYLPCRDGAGAKGRGIPANPWSARTSGGPSNGSMKSAEVGKRSWKGEPGPDFTVDVNDGHEWFAARRRDYYLLTFHGRLAPDWLSECFEGQLGFGGGVICQLTVPGRGPVLASTLNDAYGRGMHPTQWEDFHLHALVGERWDGLPIVSGISEHDDARLSGLTLASSGEIRGSRLKVTRTYAYNPDSIDCAVKLDKSDHAQVMFLWGHEGRWAEVRLAYEMIPYLPKAPDNKTPTKVLADDGAAMTTELIPTKSIRIDRGGFGVEIRFDQPTPCKLGKNNTILVELVPVAPKPTPPERVALKYKLVPFGGVEPGDPATQPQTQPQPKAKQQGQPQPPPRPAAPAPNSKDKQ